MKSSFGVVYDGFVFANVSKYLLKTVTLNCLQQPLKKVNTTSQSLVLPIKRMTDNLISYPMARLLILIFACGTFQYLVAVSR